MYAYKHVHMQVRKLEAGPAHSCICIQMHACIDVFEKELFIRVCIPVTVRSSSIGYTHTHTYIYTHIYKRTHTHTCTQVRKLEAQLAEAHSEMYTCMYIRSQ